MKKYILTLLILISIAFQNQAQNELHFSHIGRENGFPLDKANAITQDKKGFIWIGTWNGLSKYDGYTCTNFLPQYHDSTSISNREITSLFTDANGDIWAGTSNGLNYISAETNQIKTFPFNNRILSIHEDDSKNIWVGTGKGLFRLDRETGNASPFLTGETINDIHEDKYHNLWIATNSGLIRLDQKRLKHRKYTAENNRNSLSSSTVMQVVSSDDYLWIGTWGGGLNRAELNGDGSLINFTQYAADWKGSSICSNVIFRLAYDKFNNLWIGSWSDGLSMLKPDQQRVSARDAVFQTYRNNPLNNNSISSNDISALFIDRNNLLWIGAAKIDQAQSIEHGLERYALPKLNDNSLFIRCFTKRKNFLWVGANQYILEYERINGVYQFKRQYIPTGNPYNRLLTTCTILDLHADQNGLWVGTEGAGLIFYPFRNNEINPYQAKIYNTNSSVSIPDNRVSKIIPSKANPQQLWIGTMERGIAQLDINQSGASKSKTFNTLNGISNNSIRALLEDQQGNLWIGTQNGLNYFDTHENTCDSYFYSTHNAFSINDNIINHIFEDSNHNIWIGTNSGLNKKITQNEKVAFQGYPDIDYLSNELVFNIKEDKSKNLWIRMYNGVVKFNLENEAICGKFFRQDFENTRLERNSNVSISNESFVIGNNANFIVFNPDTIQSKQSSLKTSITDVLLYNKSSKAHNISLNKLSLAHHNKMISFKFSDMSFLAPNEVTYFYKLDGFDRQWNKIKGTNSVTYTNIPPGRYTFMVSSVSPDNEESISELKIRILPPWWKSKLALFIYLILIGGIVYTLKEYIKAENLEKRRLALEKMKAKEMERLNEQKSLFFTDITHELRTPLTLILEPSKELVHDPSLRAETREKVRLIKTSADKLLRLVNKLMEFRKLEQSEISTLIYTRVDLNQMMQEIFTFFQPLAHARSIDFKLNTPKEQTLIYLDLDKFEKVMFNIISNAFKYTPNKGEVSININSNYQIVRVEVNDNGIGIAKEYQERVFERFFQINQIQTQSTGGVGLYMVKELINMLQGKVELYSEPNEGSSFRIELPVKPDNNEVSDEVKTYSLVENETISFHDQEAIPCNNEAHRMLKIMIIEDDIELNKFIAAELSRNFEVKRTFNGKEALQELHSFIPDLILSDVLMPEMGGFEFAKELAKDKNFASTPVIFLTAKNTPEDEIKGFKLGAIDYINKPFDIGSLQIKIKNILSNRQKEKESIRTEHLLTPEDIKLPSANEIFLTNAVEAINRNISNVDYDVEKFSNDMNMSQNQLYRRLKALTGQTAKDFIRSQRLKVAADLLMQESREVSEVVYLVGFASPSYFSRCFKDYYGCSPTEYIKKNSK